MAIVILCAKRPVCDEKTARSVYHIPSSLICFVPIQQELAKMNLYDEKTEDIKIKCQAKS